MKKAILIAEKPDLGKKIMSAYNNHKSDFDFELDVFSQVGHLFGLKYPNELDDDMKFWEMSKFPWFPKHWEYKITEDKVKKFKKTKYQMFQDIKKAIQSGKYDFVIHAGDADQEGEILIRETLNEIGNTLPVMRIWTNASTDEEYHQGLLNMKSDNDNFFEHMYQAALGRQRTDYLIGMNYSPVLKLKTGEAANVGRLKTFINSLIVAREEEINNWKPSSMFGCVANYQEGFSGVYKTPFKTEQEAKDFSDSLSNTAKIESIETKNETTLAPPLFKLSTLQIAASKKGFDIGDVQSIVQSLYDKGYLSYPRTDCEYINDQAEFTKLLNSASVFEDLVPFIKNIDSATIENIKKNKKYVRNEIVAEAGHCALTPTNHKANLATLSDEEIDIFHMVCAQYVAIFLKPLIQKKTKIITNNNGHLFVTNGKMLVEKGYTNLLKTDITDKPLPTNISKEQMMHVDNFSTIEKKAVCPKRYTDGTLIQTLENPAKYIVNPKLKGVGKILNVSIGRPSTREPIINQLISLGYINAKKGKGAGKTLFPTDKAIRNVKNMSGNIICLADATAMIEEKLECIRTGKLSLLDYENEMKQFVIDGVNELKKKEMDTYGGMCKCHFCEGPILENAKTYSCASCNATLWKDNKYFNALGTKLTKRMAIDLLSNGEVECSDLISKKGTKYHAIIVADKNEKGLSFHFKPNNF